jgi:hypothetical protein
MGFNNVAALATSQATSGKVWDSFVFKSSLPAVAAAGVWADGSIGAGIPIYNAYLGAALEFTPLTGSANRSIYTGPTISDSKYVATAQIGTSAAGAPLVALFADYVGFYPLVDTDDTAPQTMDNTQSLPRYSSGEGVQAFCVVQVPQTASATSTVTLSYTNSAGVSGRTSTFGLFGAANIGSLCNIANTSGVASALTPFIPLQSGDKGIRSIESVSVSTSIGGFINVVLCKPIFTLQLLEQNTVAEKVFFKESGTLPEVQPGAFLQFLTLRGSATTPIPFRAALTFAWS